MENKLVKCEKLNISNFKLRASLILFCYNTYTKIKRRKQKRIHTVNRHVYETIVFIKELPYNHPAKKYYTLCNEMSVAEKIDLLLHAQECFFNIKDIITLLEDNKLYIKNFITPNINRYPDVLTKLDEFNSLSIEDKLTMGQILNFDDDQIEMIICKNKKNSLIYNKIDFDNWGLHAKGSEIDIDDELEVISFLNPNIKFKKLSVAFKVKDRERFLSYVTGKIPGKKFFKDYNKKQVKIMKEFILKMFQHGYVDFKIK